MIRDLVKPWLLLVLAVFVATLLGGVALGWRLKPAPRPTYQRVEVPWGDLWQDAPTSRPDLGTKLTSTPITPTQVATTTERDTSRVARYCAQLTAVRSASRPAPTPAHPPSSSTAVATAAPQGQTALPDARPGSAPLPSSDSATTMPALLPEFRGELRGNRFTTWSLLSDGRGFRAEYRVPGVRGHLTFMTDGDTLLVRGDRFWVRAGRAAGRCAKAAPLGGLVGALAGGLIGGDAQGAAIGAAAAGGGSCLGAALF